MARNDMVHVAVPKGRKKVGIAVGHKNSQIITVNGIANFKDEMGQKWTKSKKKM